jgi:mono/diheme cytochrome c family protein
MKTFFRFLIFAFVAILILLAAGISLTVGWRPILGPKTRALTAVKFESNPQRLARGKYLFLGVAGCAGCHSPHDLSQHGAPVIAGKEGSGEVMPVDGLPGRIVAPNLTPDPETGTGKWSDDQIARAVREGIGHDGRTLFPMMPYAHFRSMSDEDIASIIVYIRSLAPVQNQLPATEIVFPVKYLIRGVPQPVTSPVSGPDPNDQLKRGEYLVNLGDCSGCHTPAEHGQVLEGMEFAGGQVLSGLGFNGASANITPDPSGISYYDEALFIQVMRTGYVKARPLGSLMPFVEYRNMNDQDLKDVFAYLRTLKPVKHHVDNSEPVALCRLCRQKHGGGDKN